MSDSSAADAMTSVLATFRDPESTGFDNAWVGMEPTFQSRKSVRKWHEMSEEPGGEDAYFLDRYMLKTQKRVAKRIKSRYEEQRHEGRSRCLFARVELDDDLDQWHVRRQNLQFHWPDANLEPFEVRLSLDPETFEYSIKPVPLAWFYEERFVDFLEEFLWKTPQQLRLSFAIAHGGGQFSLSAKTFLTGSLLADDVAYKASHPELSTWIMDWPNPDDRAFRATHRRLAAFRRVLDQYWEGRFHPRVNGVLTAENALFDRGFGPGLAADPTLMDPKLGPTGSRQDVFQTNFAFGRTVRLAAQNVDPGYWQSAHPDEDGYRPDQIMRYSEGNLNRLQIAGELHVKSGKVLDLKRAPLLDAPLEFSLLTTEASWENRAQMSRTSARDYVEAMLLDVHHARYLQAHPHVRIASSLQQDQLLGDAEATLKRHAPQTLDRLRKESQAFNLEQSRGRIRSDRVEPETLFWAAWHALPPGEKSAVAREAISGFLERVQQAASVDPRSTASGDPMEWHRHRIHPLLWDAFRAESGASSDDSIERERAAWLARRDEYLARRPVWSQLKGAQPPWTREVNQ
jgi:hypothetical protein